MSVVASRRAEGNVTVITTGSELGGANISWLKYEGSGISPDNLVALIQSQFPTFADKTFALVGYEDGRTITVDTIGPRFPFKVIEQSIYDINI